MGNRTSLALCFAGVAAVVSGNAAAADGCADGTFSSVPSPDGNATSVLFDDFSATAGGGPGLSRATSTCQLTVPVTRADGFSVFGVDYRGFVTAEDGQTAQIVTLQDGRQVLTYQVGGPLQDDVATGGKVGISGSDTLGLTIVVETTAPIDPNTPDATLLLDTVDITRLGFTTLTSVTNSMDQLARQRQAIAAELMGTAQGLLGEGERFDAGSSISLFGTSGAAAGFKGRWEAGSGISLLGGAAIVNPDEDAVSVDTLALLAGAVRYTTPQATWRGFGEVGAWGSPNVRADLSRSYLDTSTVVSAGGTADGSLVSAYGRIGAVFAPDPANEIVLSARFTKAWLDLDGYDEPATDRNLFAAKVRGGTSSENIASAEVAWSHQTEGRLDYTLSGAVGRIFADDKAVGASVDWVGDVSGQARDQSFASAGGRIGVRLDDVWHMDTSVGATFRQYDDPEWNVGAQLKARF
ncbi:hypothetical protein ASG25_19500 [Rhizobium sp. Leaf384]|uniref:DUF4360 domain-containing protein n=1 Tax=unclassified Rhizobium TaxID=2613769 RepID=UPI000713DC0C|nr:MULTISPECIES: DUF4360 domain-containing protein [unclassified Rhizobium]KQS75557.1 hypothetical protein ASG25_19500 [Rhizobium sp. Leaf384]KQS75806.1 hypothetical protein ASG58_13180 [Rhizobium sp. Leaf383]